MNNESITRILFFVIVFCSIAALTFSVLGYFRDGDIGNLDRELKDIRGRVSSIVDGAAGLGEAINGFGKLVNGVEDISSGITESVRQNRIGLDSIRKSNSGLLELIRRIQEEGVVLE